MQAPDDIGDVATAPRSSYVNQNKSHPNLSLTNQATLMQQKTSTGMALDNLR